MERLSATVSGSVQGVYFRAYTQREAERLGLTGYARNLSDGTVEVVAEGPRAALESLLAWLRRGSPSAHVDEVRAEWHAARGAFARFEVQP